MESTPNLLSHGPEAAVRHAYSWYWRFS